MGESDIPFSLECCSGLELSQSIAEVVREDGKGPRGLWWGRDSRASLYSISSATLVLSFFPQYL